MSTLQPLRPTCEVRWRLFEIRPLPRDDSGFPPGFPNRNASATVVRDADGTPLDFNRREEAIAERDRRNAEKSEAIDRYALLRVTVTTEPDD